MDFEWDEAKRATVLAQRRIDLATMTHVFEDPDAIEGPDTREGYGEARFRIIGLANGTVFTVAFTLRKDRIRIITAWKALKNEREAYYRHKAAAQRRR